MIPVPSDPNVFENALAKANSVDVVSEPPVETPSVETPPTVAALPANHPATDKYPAYNLGSEEFRPWLVKLLSKGGMSAYDVIKTAEQHFKKQMIEGDLIEKRSGDGKRVQFAHAWQHRLYCAREGMVKAGLIHPFGNFRRVRNWWALTPKGMLPEHRKGY